MNKYEILGVGTPIIDHILHVDDRFMDTIPGQRGGMVPIDHEYLDELLKKAAESNFHPISMPGGSCANTIRGLAHLGYKCALLGVIGNDSWGKSYGDSITQLGITPLFQASALPTSQVLCLVTPNGERTCRAFLGASQEMHADKIPQDFFQNVKLVHLEGYSLLQNSLTETVMSLTKQADSILSFELSSFEIINQFKIKMTQLLPQFADILFANEIETQTFVGAGGEEGCSRLLNFSKTAIVMQGKEGCWVGSSSVMFHEKTFPVNVVDTTGAGDLFASGFLGAYLANKSLKECAKLGHFLGSATVQVSGATLSPEVWSEAVAKLRAST